MKLANEIKLVEEAAKGNTRAFNELIALNYDYFLKMAIKRTKNVALAKDILQDTLIEAYLNIEKLKEKQLFRPWLTGILRNVCNNYYRRKQRFFVPLECLNEVLFEDNVAAENKELKAALIALNEREKNVIERFYYENWSIKDIAEQEEISLSAAKVRLHRARKTLQSIMLKQITKPTTTEIYMPTEKAMTKTVHRMAA
ncbi:MAG: RNA polymerase sigma factor [Chitinophagales bacterium]